MRLIVVDFETAFSKDFSLAKMPTDAYILDPLFQVLGVGIKVEDEPSYWVPNTEDDLAVTGALRSIEWSDVAVICQNTLFDGFILTQRYGIRPKLWMDTLCMARMLYPWEKSHSLAAQAQWMGVGVKGTDVQNNIGKWLKDFTPAELAAYGRYCCNDCDLTYSLATKYMHRIPAIEFKLVDMTIRMFTEPKLVGDAALMDQQYEQEVARKAFLLSEARISKETIMSNDKFAEALRDLGVEPPLKTSPATGQQTYAFAKTDKDFTALQEHPDADVQAVVAARLGVKTTIAETRAKRMAETARRGPLPVYLNYWGAKVTGRYSGGNQINWQNIPARGPSAGLRNAILAPEGCKVVVGDSANIELRVAMVLAGQTDVVDKIRAGEDLYCDFASKLFGEVITKANKKERTIGKIAMLSLQYGAGWTRFKDMVRIQSKEVLSDDNAKRVVDLYRAVHGHIVALWEHCNTAVLSNIYNGGGDMMPLDKQSWCLTGNGGFGVLGSPGVVYHYLRKEPNTNDWVYTMGSDLSVKIFGAKVVENAAQHVARQIVMWQTARINERYPVALSVHDEAVIVVGDEEVDEARVYMTECLSMAPPWCGEGVIPLACDVGVGQSYGEAKP